MSGGRWAAAAATVGLVWGCSGAAGPAPAATEPAPAASGSAAWQEGPKRSDEEAERLVAAMLERVVASRKLSARSKVAAKGLERQALLDQVREHADGDVPHDVVRSQGTVLQALGWIPPTYDYEKGVFDLLEAQLAGYYDPDKKMMFLALDLPEEEAEATLAHELVHALQDQHYDLGPKLKYRPESGDTPGALQALAEGDATSAMIDVMLAKQGTTALDLPEKLVSEMMLSQTMGSIASVPPVLKASLVAPYVDGMRFVHALRRRGGWAEVDKAWRSPPTTTEQLLHLDKYDARERAVAVPAPPTDALGGGFRVVFTDLFGEQSLAIAFEEWASRREARAAAAGWGGDRVALMARRQDNHDQFFVTWWIRFDGKPASCSEANEAFALVARGISPQGGNPAGAAVCRERPEMGPLGAVLTGCDVVVVAGPFAKSGESWRSESTCDKVRPWLLELRKSAVR